MYANIYKVALKQVIIPVTWVVHKTLTLSFKLYVMVSDMNHIS